jgi:hypothetical protein
MALLCREASIVIERQKAFKGLWSIRQISPKCYQSWFAFLQRFLELGWLRVPPLFHDLAVDCVVR